MDILDLLIVLLLVIGLYSGWRRGLTWVGCSFAGLTVGLVVGGTVAPPIARHFAGHNPSAQSLIGTGFFLGSIAIFQGVGTAVGYRVRVAALRRSRLAQVDSWAGSGLAAIGVLMGVWYLGITFAQSPYDGLSNQIRNSGIVRGLDRVAPHDPPFLADIEQILHGNSFPLPFSGLGPQSVPDVPVPTDINTPGILAARKETTKVLSSGSCGTEAGSAWPVANDYLITNAHVVAGGSSVRVVTPDGATHRATVVLFDPSVDVAILHTPGLGLSPLALLSNDPGTGDNGAVIGYPHGDALTTVPAAVSVTERATGRDIYGGGLTTRTIEVLKTPQVRTSDGRVIGGVIPGDSGGPVVNRDGQVLGLVFAASTSDPTEGYALALSQIRPDIQSGISRTAAVSTQDCTP